MELFARAKTVRLKSRHDKYLYADEDELKVSQDRDGASANARWTVEAAPGGKLRLRSSYGRYLTASPEPFLLGATGRKVLQTAPEHLDSSVDWEPLRDGFQVRLKTRRGDFLRANGGVPPWRNSVTHDVPHRSSTQDWVLWDVEIVQLLTPPPQRVDPAPAPPMPPTPPAPQLKPRPQAGHHQPTKSYAEESTPPPPPQEHEAPGPNLARLKSDPFAPLHRVEGRAIHYHIADDMGNVNDDNEGHSFIFNGSNLEELTHKLVEETCLKDVIICTRSPITQKLTPLHLQLPPNNAAMHIVLVRESSKVAQSFPWPYGA